MFYGGGGVNVLNRGVILRSRGVHCRTHGVGDEGWGWLRRSMYRNSGGGSDVRSKFPVSHFPS